MQMHEQPEKGQKKGAPVGRPSSNVSGLGRFGAARLFAFVRVQVDFAQTNALGRHLDEFVFGRPAATADVYSFTTTVDSATGTATVVFPTVTGRNYRVYWSHTLLASDWQAGSAAIPGTGANVSWTDNGPPAPRKFYKIEASTAP